MDFFLLASSCLNPSQERTFIPQKMLQPIPFSYAD